MRTSFILALCLALAGCSNTFESALLKVKYEPPRGVKLSGEETGPPAVARFTQGIELRSVPAAPPTVDEAHLEALLEEVRAASKLSAPGRMVSARTGTLSIGPVVRFEVKDRDSRSLVYFIPLEGRYLVASVTAPESRYGMLETQVERSLSTLERRP
ncbi:MAG: hypothetical protein ACYC8T_37070 [Myxococcaceae bacterium]